MNGILSYARCAVLLFALTICSCTALPEHEPHPSGKGYIMSDVCFSTAVSVTKAEIEQSFETIPVTDDIDASLHSVASGFNRNAPTRSTLVSKMYDTFGFGVDETVESGNVLKVGIDNEKMTCSRSDSYVSSNLYQKYYTCSTDGADVSYWGYAPYSKSGLSCLKDGRRVINLTIDDPESQEDVIATWRDTGDSQACISPIENPLNFNHILSAVRFLYNGSSGVSGVIESIRVTNVSTSGYYCLKSGSWVTAGSLSDLNFPVEVEFGPDDNSLELLGDDEHLLMIPQDFSGKSCLEIDYSLYVKQSGSVRRGTLKASLASLGEWKSGVSVDYVLSFRSKMQTVVDSSVPDTLFWNWNEGPDNIKKMYIQGRNLDISVADASIGGEDSGHWKISATQYIDEGKTVELSLYPVEKNSGDVKDAVVRFFYPDVPAAGSVSTALVHYKHDLSNQIFAALKKPDWLAASDLGNGFVAVRPSRAGKVYLYLNNDGLWGSQNNLGSHGGTSDNDWVADFDSIESEYGISCDYDESSHSLDFSVASTQKFLSHLGCMVELQCVTVSGGTSIKIPLKLMPDISVNGLDDFYVGMKRYPSVTGFCGDVTMKEESSSGMIRYGSDRAILGNSPVSIQNVYSYKGGSVSLTFESDDDFNDSACSKDIDILDPAPAIELSDSKFFVHGDEVSVTVQYCDVNGDEIPASSFDAVSYENLLRCDMEFRAVSGKPFLGAGNYAFTKLDDGYEAYVCSIPDDYAAETAYQAELVATPAYDSSVHGSTPTYVPAFDANGVSSCIATINDYLSLNPGNPVSVRSDRCFTYGVKSLDDLVCSVSPSDESSCENDCITATVSAKEDGYITFSLSDPDPEDMLCTHSVGKHIVEVGTSNKHSGERIFRSDLRPYIDVYIHVGVGAGVYLSEYSEDNCVTAYLFGEAVPDVEKCSISRVYGESFVKPVSSEYSADVTIYNWQSLAIRADIEVESHGAYIGEDYPFLVVTFSVNTSGATEQQVENARTIINNVWNDDTGNAFFAYGGLWGTVPGMSFYNNGKVTVEKLGEFYYVHTLLDLNQSSRGWMNVHYGIGMPHDGYSL